MAKYKKKRARELKHDQFRDTTMKVFERIGDRLEGKGRVILYAIGGVIVLSLLFWAFTAWRHKKNEEAQRALGRAIEIQQAEVSASPAPPGQSASALRFPTETERAQRAMEEFQKVAAKYPSYNEIARYFIATNLLTVNRQKGLSELEALSKSSDQKVAVLSKFALAQAREADGQLDAAAALYNEIAHQSNSFIPPDTANLRLAAVYERQGKKKEAADILFQLLDAARKAKAPDGKPAPLSAAARDASQKLQRLDPERYAQLPPEPAPTGMPF
ncbi:MAG TPA: hypothetical protein VK619_05185 [Pyrinomonadaceae bacterium]|nr:hypothetical protein [Pyrinomonadaceae bacterium]